MINGIRKSKVAKFDDILVNLRRGGGGSFPILKFSLQIFLHMTRSQIKFRGKELSHKTNKSRMRYKGLRDDPSHRHLSGNISFKVSGMILG